jgi:ribonuclease HI
MKLDVFIDGSHLNKQSDNGRLGIGGVVVDMSSDKIIDQFSIELTPSFMKDNFGADKCSNPSAELTALYIALQRFKGVLSKADSVVFHADYLGVKEWMMGSWKTKEPYIAKIKECAEEEIKNQGLTNKVSYVWVKGHQNNNTSKDAYWNNYVDKLAKGE